MSSARATITGVGSALPELTVANDWFEASPLLETSDAWIRQRTGITRRHVIGEGQPLRELALAAARSALASAATASDRGTAPADGGRGAAPPVDLLIVASTTPDDLFGDAAAIAAALGAPAVAPGCAAFDVRAACNGFLVAMLTAANFLKVTSSLGGDRGVLECVNGDVSSSRRPPTQRTDLYLSPRRAPTAAHL